MLIYLESAIHRIRRQRLPSEEVGHAYALLNILYLTFYFLLFIAMFSQSNHDIDYNSTRKD